MRLRIISNLLGTMLLVLSITMIFPAIWAVHYSDGDLIAIVYSFTATLLAGIIFLIIGKSAKDITLKESFAFVTLGWILAAFFGALPFIFSGVLPSFIDAFFEAMSGFTTTGATVITDVEAVPSGILFWRSLTHWLGGMGIIVLFVAILPRFGFGGTYLLKAEVPGLTPERITPRIAQTAKILWFVYVFISFVQVILLSLAGLSLFDSLTHTFGTMATGGFSTRNASIAGLYNFKAEFIIIVFMLIAGGNFSLYFAALKGNIKAVFKNSEFRFYLLFTAAASLLISVNIYFFNVHEIIPAIRQGVFQTVSIITTTGFTTANFDAWHPFSRALIFFLMFAGGSGGSTAGAIKQIRVMVLFKYIYRETLRVIHPNLVLPIKIGKKVIPEQLVSNTLGFIFLYFLIFIFAVLLISSFGIEIVCAFSAVAATLGNIGPGLGLVGPLNTYYSIPCAGKVILSFLMLLGRLEIYTIVVLFLSDYSISFFSLKSSNFERSSK